MTATSKILRSQALALAVLAASCATTSSAGSGSFQVRKLSAGDEPHLPEGFSSAGPSCGSSVAGAYKLCLTQEGDVRSVDTVRGIADADAEIIATLRTWRYQPISIPLCFVQNLEFHIDCQKLHPPAPVPKVVAASLLEAQKVSTGDDPPPPAAVQKLECGRVMNAAYELCLGEAGTVRRIKVIDGIPGADEPIIDTLKRWQYRPQVEPVCFVRHLEFRAPCTEGGAPRPRD